MCWVFCALSMYVFNLASYFCVISDCVEMDGVGGVNTFTFLGGIL